MPVTDQVQLFRAMHHDGSVLVLPNAWDAGSARLMVGLGAKAVATTSSGLAWAHGYADGNKLPVKVYAEALRQIARIVSCPVSADAEAGYSDDVAEAGENLACLIDTGIVGINLEDGTSSPDLLCRKIEAAKAAGLRAGIDLFVNARTDVFLKGLAPGRELAESLRRGAAYASAGADGLFVPNAVRPADIEALASGQALPLNVMARPGLPTLAELARLGVRRLSAGGAIAQASLATAKRLAATFLAEGCTDALFAESLSYAEGNALMS
jgi:2-methylisocitrate lyase-like PEP mutase family enzyme